MRAMLIAAAIIGGLTVNANAQLNLKVATDEPVTGLSPQNWAVLARRMVNAAPIKGKPEVYMVNATPQPLTVNCEKWELVGDHPYISDNPKILPPWTVTLVNANGFDGYCRGGVTGQTGSGDVYRGALNSGDHSFSDSTFITFGGDGK